SSGGPLVSIRTEDGRAVGVVQEHEVTRQLVQVGRDFFREDAERRIAVAAAIITEHLVVSAILFQDINDVPEDARLADALGHRPGRLVWTGWQRGEGQLVTSVVVPNNL